MGPSTPTVTMPTRAGTSIRSTAHCRRSQFLQKTARKQTPSMVAMTWWRLRMSGAANLAAVDTHTRMTVTMASMMLMLLPSSTRASWFSSCTAGTSIRSTAHCRRSQFLQKTARKQTPSMVAMTWWRLRMSGAANLAAVDTHTRMTVTMASMMLMLLPSSTRASWFSSCTVCCCCCCSSSLETRV
ncbi:hypothetical protein CRUP_016685 [Coryphaenoides rupestris]|nr:hypothetical protein CRUP_016685 [Coryphaenoides rupestris]